MNSRGSHVARTLSSALGFFEFSLGCMFILHFTTYDVAIDIPKYKYTMNTNSEYCFETNLILLI